MRSRSFTPRSTCCARCCAICAAKRPSETRRSDFHLAKHVAGCPHLLAAVLLRSRGVSLQLLGAGRHLLDLRRHERTLEHVRLLSRTARARQSQQRRSRAVPRGKPATGNARSARRPLSVFRPLRPLRVPRLGHRGRTPCCRRQQLGAQPSTPRWRLLDGAPASALRVCGRATLCRPARKGLERSAGRLQ